jgi:Bacterial TniB protein
MKHFSSLHQATEASGGTIAAPVFYLQCPGMPDESRLYNSILLKLCKKFRPGAPPQEKLLLVLDALSKIEIRILALDEVNFTEAGTVAKQKHFLNALRYLANRFSPRPATDSRPLRFPRRTVVVPVHDHSVEGKRRGTSFNSKDQPTPRAIWCRSWQTKKYALDRCRSLERKTAWEGLIRLRDQTGGVDLIQLKAFVKPAGFSLHHRRA